MAAESGLHISLAAEPIAHIGAFPITNSLLMTWLTMVILILFALIVRKKINTIPTGIQNIFEMVVEYFETLIQSVTQNAKQTRKFFPIIFTFFIFILLSNYLGLLPGVGTITITPKEETHAVAPAEDSHDSPVVDSHSKKAAVKEEAHAAPVPILRPPNADLNATLAWSFISVIAAQIFGITALGFFGYSGKFFPFHKLFVMKKGFPTPSFMGFIEFFIGLLEALSEVAKIISFSFRLFGNVFAGEVLLVVIAFLASYIAPLPFYGLELFVGLIQALVFAMLTLVFLKIATLSHGDHEEHNAH